MPCLLGLLLFLQPPREAYVVMAPFYGLEDEAYRPTPNLERFAVLLDRHIQVSNVAGAKALECKGRPAICIVWIGVGADTWVA